jgi:hypothetical protein
MSDLTDALIRRLSVGGTPATVDEYEALAAELSLPMLPDYIDLPNGEAGGKIRVVRPIEPEPTPEAVLFADAEDGVEVEEPKSEVDTSGNGG